MCFRVRSSASLYNIMSYEDVLMTAVEIFYMGSITPGEIAINWQIKLGKYINRITYMIEVRSSSRVG